MDLRYHARTHRGRRFRHEHAHGLHPELGLFTLAVGLSDEGGGDLASRLTVDVLRNTYSGVLDESHRGSLCELHRGPRCHASERGMPSVRHLRPATCAPRPRPRDAIAPVSSAQALQRAIARAAATIRACARGALANLGATVAALAVVDGWAVVGHVGDIRVYRLRAGALTPLTRDHTLYNAIIDAGANLYPARAEQFRHVLTRALGRADTEPDLRVEPLQHGDRFLLCSAGVLAGVDEGSIATALRTDPDRACERLVTQARQGGARDGLTAVVVSVRGWAQTADDLEAPRHAPRSAA